MDKTWRVYKSKVHEPQKKTNGGIQVILLEILHQLVNPIASEVLYITGGARFLPSTVSLGGCQLFGNSGFGSVSSDLFA